MPTSRGEKEEERRSAALAAVQGVLDHHTAGVTGAALKKMKKKLPKKLNK